MARPRTGVARRRAAALAGTIVVVVAACSTGPAEVDAPAAPPTGPEAPAAPPDPDADDGSASDVAPGLPRSDIALPTLVLEPVTQLEAPVATERLPSGTVLIAERAGRVRILAGSDPGAVVLDVSDRTTTDGERGLFDLAVAPWGDELFVSRTDQDGDTLVEAYPLEDDRVVDAPRTVYTLAQPFPNHNGGALLFLPDGTLLLGLGDGGGAGDPLGAGQDVTTPLGGLVRLEVEDTVGAPSDNPYLGVAGAAPELAAIGLRNPWRMHLDAPREELWIADVGQNAYEEIDRVPLDELLGANFGWPLREGGERFLGDEPDGHVAPVHTYPHGPGCSITGGIVYRGAALPELVGGYVFSDLCDGELRVLLVDSDGVVARPLGVEASRPIGLGTDAAGELLVLELGGRVLRLIRG